MHTTASVFPALHGCEGCQPLPPSNERTSRPYRRRFEKGLDPQARFLSCISQPGRLWLYLLTCIAIAAAVYGGVLRAIDWLFFAGVSATLVLYQIVNFHHYIVDAIIWRSPKPAPPPGPRRLRWWVPR